MRRKDREKDAAFAFNVLRDCEYATLATINPDGTPYCIPLSPVLVDNTVYFHCAKKGRKLTNIIENSAVCISGVSYTNLVPEQYTTEYESFVATGKCEIVTNDEEKIMALRRISEKFAQSAIEQFDSRMAQWAVRTTVCKIEIENITGKANRLT